MKKAAAIVLLIGMLVCLCACGGGMTVTKLEESIRENTVDDDMSFERTETDDGFTFTYNSSGVTWNGTAGKNEQITSLTLTLSQESVSELRDKSGLLSLVAKMASNPGDVTLGEFKTLQASEMFYALFKAMGGSGKEFSDAQLDTVNAWLSGTAQEFHGWTIQSSGSDTVTVSITK